jgi:hypothetical protein
MVTIVGIATLIVAIGTYSFFGFYRGAAILDILRG